MLYVVAGYFKPGVDPEPAALQDDFNEHLAQTNLRIRAAGPLRDRDGKRIGFMGLVETEGFDRAQAFIDESPYAKAGLYDRIEVAQYVNEVGTP
jgi:uncharacterized protein YciI